MKGSILTLLLILSLSPISKAIDTTYHKNTLTLTPTTLINLTGKPGIELGYERLLNDRIGLCSEVVLVRDFFNFYDPFDFSKDFKGMAVGFSFRYYSKPFKILPIFDLQSEPGFRLFLSPGFYYNQNSRSHSNEFYRTDSTIYLDDYKIIRNETAYFLDLGLRDNTGRFIAEFVGGFGFVIRNTSHLERENKNDISTLAAGEYFLFEHEPEQRYNLPLFRYKMTFGYRF